MNPERISELRALCAEYKRKKATCEAAGLKDKAADIAADGVGRRALEALPDLLDELEITERAFDGMGSFIQNNIGLCVAEFVGVVFEDEQEYTCNLEYDPSNGSECCLCNCWAEVFRNNAEKELKLENEGIHD